MLLAHVMRHASKARQEFIPKRRPSHSPFLLYLSLCTGSEFPFMHRMGSTAKWFNGERERERSFGRPNYRGFDYSSESSKQAKHPVRAMTHASPKQTDWNYSLSICRALVDIEQIQSPPNETTVSVVVDQPNAALSIFYFLESTQDLLYIFKQM